MTSILTLNCLSLSTPVGGAATTILARERTWNFVRRQTRTTPGKKSSRRSGRAPLPRPPRHRAPRRLITAVIRQRLMRRIILISIITRRIKEAKEQSIRQSNICQVGDLLLSLFLLLLLLLFFFFLGCYSYSFFLPEVICFLSRCS